MVLIGIVRPEIGVAGCVVTLGYERLPDLRLVLKQLPDTFGVQAKPGCDAADRPLPGHDQGVLINLHRVELAGMSIAVWERRVGVRGEARPPAEPVETVDAGVVHHHADHLLCFSVFIIPSVHTMSRRKEKKVVSGQTVLEARSTLGIRRAGLAKNDRIRGRRSQDDWAPGHICLEGGSSSPGAPKHVWRGGAKKPRFRGA